MCSLFKFLCDIGFSDLFTVFTEEEGPNSERVMGEFVEELQLF
jgi:hypothetical protein